MATPESVSAHPRFTAAELEQFQQDGFAVVRGIADASICRQMLEVTRAHVERLVAPIEFEADLNYPGSPAGFDAPGGSTVRRLMQAHSRDFVFTRWLTHPGLLSRLAQLLGDDVYCPLSHHNCVMTKHPEFSSETGWHQDIRYWSFQQPELITAWLALGREFSDKGCLRVVPGSHRENLDRGRFDEETFFRTDLPENQALLERAESVELEAGDVLFFHCRTLHGASRNLTDETKYLRRVHFSCRRQQPDSRNALLVATRTAVLHAPV